MDEILTALLPGEIVSGEKMSESLGITRMAVWKKITALRERGFDIESVGRRSLWPRKISQTLPRALTLAASCPPF
ncbi:MAG: HTH domain-containing protein [Clostridia bacterium]|nr:HTH domain-containing protein [Clostridia bacterium]